MRNHWQLPGRPDLGVRSTHLPSPLAASYVVETDFDAEIAELVREHSLEDVLEEAVRPLREYFGGDTRLMLAAPWRLTEPIEPVVHVVVYTRLSREAAADALERFRAEWTGRGSSEVVFVAVPIEGLRGD